MKAPSLLRFGSSIATAAAFLSMSGLVGCTSLLTAKFESDTIGGLPDRTLPGAPTGDEMIYVPEIETQLEIVATTGSTGKSLRYRDATPSAPISGHSKWVSFKARSSNFSKPITFTWSGRKSVFSSDLTVDYSDGMGVLAARVIIKKNGDVILVNDISQTTGENLGYVGNDLLHTVLLTVDLPNAVYNVSVLKASGNLIRNGRPLLTPDITAYHNPARPTVSFLWTDNFLANNYVFDEVFIRRRKE